MMMSPQVSALKGVACVCGACLFLLVMSTARMDVATRDALIAVGIANARTLVQVSQD